MERDTIVDKLIKDFSGDMCPYPDEEKCRMEFMECGECFKEYFESFRKGDPDAPR